MIDSRRDGQYDPGLADEYQEMVVTPKQAVAEDPAGPARLHRHRLRAAAANWSRP